MLEKELENIGLNEKEAKVYVAALELGRATAQQIAQRAGLKRPTTYFTIEGLMKRGLMSSFHEKKKQFFVAESPERLIDVFEEKRDELRRQGEKLNKLIPDLKKLSQNKTDKPIVKYYVGKEGALSMAKSILEVGDKEEVLMAYNADKVLDLFSEEEQRKIRFALQKDNVKIKALYTSKKHDLKNTKISTRIKIDEKKYPLNADVAFFGNKVRLTALDKGEVVGIVIENENIAEALKSIFKLAWGNVKKNK